MSVSMEDVLQEMFDKQQEKLLQMARVYLPNCTVEDILQPMDHRNLETNPEFRFEEGVWFGLGEALAAIRYCRCQDT